MRAPPLARAAFAAVAFACGLVLGAPQDAPAGEALRLVEIAARYADTGDLDAAHRALAKVHATPKQLMKALKEARPFERVDLGAPKLPLEDGHGGKTDLFLSVPS